MKRKDDDLLRLAFGELSDETACAVESQANASERAEIEAFRRLREGLDAMPIPPPDGLSAERLRAAILDRELKGRRPRFAWGGFLLAPAALAALATVVILPRLRPRAEPQLVLDESHIASSPVPSSFGFRDRVALNDAMSAPAVPSSRRVPAAQARSIAKAEPQRARRRHRSVVVEPQVNSGKDLLALNTFPEDEPGGVLPLGPAAVSASVTAKRPEPETIAAPPSKVEETKPGQAGRTQTVVLVSGQRDLETGAPAATEKEAASVLVGG